MQARQARAPAAGRDRGRADRGLHHGDSRAARQGLDRELDEALALAGARPGEGKALLLLDGLDHPRSLVVSVPDADLSALGRIELDLRGHPLLEAVLVGERLPDLLGSSLDHGLAL